MTVLAPAARVPQLHFGRVLLFALAALLFALGWTAGKVWTAVAGGASWCGAAVRLGWQAARQPRTG